MGQILQKKAKEVYGDKYDYSKVEYVNNKTKIIITCPIHGDFEQIPSRHLLGKGCPQCYYTTRRFTNNEFIQKTKEVHGDKYDYSKVHYKSSKEKVVITCPIHGDFKQSPNDHLTGRGCLKCGAYTRNNKNKSNKEEFIEKSNGVHNDWYNYSKVKYKHSKEKVTITCPVHGDFEQKPIYHLSGRGCPECAKENSGFWNPEYIRKYHQDKLNNPCTLYVLECYSDNESFIKIGITTKTIAERYHHESLLNGYQYNTLFEHHSTLICCSEMEQEVLQSFKGCQHTPLYKFEGSTECLEYEVLDDILSIIKQKESNAL